MLLLEYKSNFLLFNKICCFYLALFQHNHELQLMYFVKKIKISCYLFY